MPDQPDLLLFVSDQHTGRLMGCAGDRIVDTPHMDALATAGTRFSAANTPCPLCVPARHALMTGQLPSHTGIYSNGNIGRADLATFAHSLGAAGYETVLCGRMHFTGLDQRRGFERREVGDFTPCLDGRGGAKRSDLGPYVETPSWNWAKHFGGGDSPVLAYDRAVTEAALRLLDEPRDRPLLLVVGIYGPHHTFVAPPELYAKYRERVEEPIAPDPERMHPVERGRITDDERLTPDVVHDIRAAYYGMIEHVDGLLGRVLSAWDAHLQRNGRRGARIYCSDHGEMGGNHGRWGKTSFYEDSVGVPLLVAGDGLRAGAVIDTPVSLVDLAPTLCGFAGAEPLPDGDGDSLVPALRAGELDPERTVVSDLLLGGNLGRMVRQGRWKYLHFHGHVDDDRLVDPVGDPTEHHDHRDDEPAVAARLRQRALQDWDPEALLADQQRRAPHQHILSAWGARVPWPDSERWAIPESSWALPQR